MDDDGAISNSRVLLVLNFSAYCDVLWAGKPINFFCGVDLLEKKLFPPREPNRFQDIPLPYGEKR